MDWSLYGTAGAQAFTCEGITKDVYVHIFNSDNRRNPLSSKSQLGRSWDAIMKIRGLNGGV